MRKTEKFYENFNNLKVSPEQAVERFEFRDVKTLDGMVSQANSLQSKMTKAREKFIDADIKSEDAVDATIKADNKYEEQKDKIADLRKKHNQEEEKAEGVQRKLHDAYNKLDQKSDVAVEKAIKAASEGKGIKSQVEAFVDKMKSAIQTFETSAKSMGVLSEVSGKIEKYKSAMRKLDASSMVKFMGY